MSFILDLKSDHKFSDDKRIHFLSPDNSIAHFLDSKMNICYEFSMKNMANSSCSNLLNLTLIAKRPTLIVKTPTLI
jgi:hypothetical protein